MGTLPHSAPIVSLAGDAARALEVSRLRAEITRMQRRRADAPLLPLDPAISALLPDGGLRVGSAYTLTPSPSLVHALLAPPSQKGTWCAIVGMRTIGIEAMAAAGVDLTRVVLVPDPGPRWLAVTSALSEVVPLIAVAPQSRVRDSDITRLNARLRDRACTLLVTAPWPQSEASIHLHDAGWQGLHDGWGLLHSRTVTISAISRSRPTPQQVRVQLPGPDGALGPTPCASSSEAPQVKPILAAVG